MVVAHERLVSRGLALGRHLPAEKSRAAALGARRVWAGSGGRASGPLAGPGGQNALSREGDVPWERLHRVPQGQNGRLMGFGVLVPQRAALLTVLGVLSARPLSDFTLE